jgi:hypothetical protein
MHARFVTPRRQPRRERLPATRSITHRAGAAEAAVLTCVVIHAGAARRCPQRKRCPSASALTALPRLAQSCLQAVLGERRRDVDASAASTKARAATRAIERHPTGAHGSHMASPGTERIRQEAPAAGSGHAIWASGFRCASRCEIFVVRASVSSCPALRLQTPRLRAQAGGIGQQRDPASTAPSGSINRRAALARHYSRAGC